MPKIINPNKSRNHVTITPDLANESIVDIDRAVIEQLYKKHGAILFRGYAFDLDIFKELIRNLCTHSIPNESGGRTMVDKEYLIQTVNSGTAGFSLHPELSRVP